ncbi:MAG TPA: ABC-2 family transporter protein [Thermotogota bacterium]|nr:ABC-2 family transporter protein [Thermotogota bacterium]HPJ87773.1 ABC-2 family transporter protein [Thermotogota bacterium]HPR95229.1 ABC-2 family transporter protein [Thermotogota bacterium]
MKKLIKLIWRYFKFNLSAQMEYRANFLIQTFGMVLNDVFLLFFWWILFGKVGMINDYQMGDMMLVYSVVTISFGISLVFFGNLLNMTEIIIKGELDSYLLLPQEELSHILVSRISLGAMGDFIFGMLLFFFTPYASAVNFLILIGVSILASFIFTGFNIIFQSLTFYIGNSTTLARVLPESVLTFSLNPPSIFNGAVRIILFTAIPSMYFSFIPISIIKEFNLLSVLILVAAAIIFMGIGILLFKRGLKKYESGNLIVKRM